MSVDLLNYSSNCATKSFEVENRISDVNDDTPSVTITVAPVIAGGGMDCYCPFNISYTIRNLEKSKFYLTCWWFEGLVELTEGEPLVFEYNAENVVIGGLKYTLLKTTHQALLAYQSSWDGESQILNIPSEVEYEGEKYTVTSINESVFRTNNTITKIIIPKTIKNTRFGSLEGFVKNSFCSCLSLKTIEVEEGNPALCSIEGVLFNKDMTTLIGYPAGSPRESYTLPDGVKIVANGAFIYNQHLKNIVLSDNIEALGYNVFAGSESLEEVILPSKIPELRSYLFKDCKKLKSVVIPDAVATIGSSAFEGCSSLESISLPESVVTVEMAAFKGCTSLRSATLSPNLKEIPLAAFSGCSKLTEVIIPSGITTIGNGAFSDCKSIQAFDLPESITFIDNFAFRNISNLKDIYCRATTVPKTNDFAFKDVDFSRVILHVPAASIEVYKNTNPWRDFKSIVPLETETDYRPLVEEGKHWTYDNFMPMRPAKYDHYYYYDLKGDTLIAGKKCLKMYSENRDNNNNIYYEAALYEENKKVYYFAPGKDKAELLYDFDCEEGDTIHVSAERMVVKNIRTANQGGISYKIYTLQLIANYEEDFGKIYWIEGVGSIQDFFEMMPTAGNYSSLNACELNSEKLYQWIEADHTAKGYHKMGIEGKRWNYIHYYVDENGEHRDPYSYVVKGDTIIRRTTYKKLWYQDEKIERFVCLLYESGREVFKSTDLGYDSPILTSFFVFSRDDFGRVFTWKSKVNSDNTNWMVYGVDTINVNNRPFRRYTCLQKYSDEGKVLSTIAYDGEGVWHDIWVEGVGSATSGIENQIPYHEPPVRQPNDYTYFVSCYEDGECIFTAEDFDAPATKPDINVAYHPFVEDGKVWKVGAIGSGNPVLWVEYFYFDGDTVVDGKTCKRMMRQRYVSPNYEFYNNKLVQDPSYVGAWYEEDKKVYTYDDRNKQFRLMYDFSLNANDTFQMDGLTYVIGPKQTGVLSGFKGVYRKVVLRDGENNIYSPAWLEGVGSTDCPTTSVYPGYVDPMWFLMSCTVGDEVIYLNDGYEDGATPEVMGVRNRFDFTHTIKTKPKAPRMEGATQSLYGEYNSLQLGINLDPLDDVYFVRIADQTGKAVYEKTVNAGSIVGLNIDISAYAAGRYTVTMENSSETFTGTFDVQTTGISLTPALSRREGAIYNLQGQRISSLQKGLNIVNGRKVLVK